MRYKLYHIPFWMVYHYLWWSVTVGDPGYVAVAMFSFPYGVKNAFYIVFQALGVYFNLYFLMPHLLEHGRYGWYAVFVILTIIAVALCIVPGYYMTAWLSDQSLESIYGVSSSNFWHFVQHNTLLSSAASMTLAMSIRLAKSSIETRRREVRLKQENLETELKLLKYQFNPHFLFNTINSIFFLIHKNPDQASASLAKFSEILRHQLYNSNDQLIPLSKEVQYLDNFVTLEKLRQNDYVSLNVDIQQQNLAGVQIAPFILMAFVENAFKHVSRVPNNKNWIEIRLSVADQRLVFKVSNSVCETRTSISDIPGGIGLPNVRRRLQLMYPDRHDLEILVTFERFDVKLIMYLSDEVVINGAASEMAPSLKMLGT